MPETAERIEGKTIEEVLVRAQDLIQSNPGSTCFYCNYIGKSQVGFIVEAGQTLFYLSCPLISLKRSTLVKILNTLEQGFSIARRLTSGEKVVLNLNTLPSY